MKTVLLKIKENTKVKVTEDTQYVLDFGDISKENRYFLELVFEKPGVTAELIGIYRLAGGETLNMATILTHQAPSTKCTTYIKGILENGSKSFYWGLIKIHKNASQTDSFLHDKVLVLGKDTENVSEPRLEIENNDVKASHGATTGRVNEEDLYYLMSRGLTQEESEKVIVRGFVEDLLSKISNPQVREKIALRVESKL